MLSYLFGQFLLERGLISTEELTNALRYQRSQKRVLGELAVELGLLDRQKILQILEWQLSVDKDFGQVAKELGFLNAEQLERLLELQQERHVYLGAALVTQGVLTPAELDDALKLFHVEKEKVLKAVEPEEELTKDTAAALFSLISKMLPRLSGGKVVSGGFYPTIADPEYPYIFSQRLCGEMEFTAHLAIPEELLQVLGESFPIRGMNTSKHGNRDKKVRAVKDFLKRVLEVFTAKQRTEGANYHLDSDPLRISRKNYLSRKKRVLKSSCAEFFLIAPPGPEGEFLQFNICLHFNR